MAMPASTLTETRRRVVLVDFDWEDANLIPELLSQPGISVRLVAGSTADEAGVRLAELCGLPRTVDLADLTREIFDLALVSERSPRRTQIEGLLLALGTPSLSPQSFMADECGPDTVPAVEAPLALHAAALETTLGGPAFDSLVEEALPDISDEAPTAPRPVTVAGEPRFVIPSLDEFPSLEGRQDLEAALRAVMSDTGAGRAELHVEGPQGNGRVEVGPEDAILRELVERARRSGTPQVVASVSGPPESVAWGAWPFRTAQHRGVLAAAGIKPATGWSRWQAMVEELRTTWDHQDRAKAAPAFPMVPAPRTGMLEAEEFFARLNLAVERNRRDGLRFALHRLEFPISTAALELLGQRLPNHLRDTDSICRAGTNRMLLLTATPFDRFPYVRGRIQALWQEVWLEAGHERPIPGVGEERIEMADADDAERFLAQAQEWMSED
jgi:hypothetical protein